MKPETAKVKPASNDAARPTESRRRNKNVPPTATIKLEQLHERGCEPQRHDEVGQRQRVEQPEIGTTAKRRSAGHEVLPVRQVPAEELAANVGDAGHARVDRVARAQLVAGDVSAVRQPRKIVRDVVDRQQRVAPDQRRPEGGDGEDEHASARCTRSPAARATPASAHASLASRRSARHPPHDVDRQTRRTEVVVEVDQPAAADRRRSPGSAPLHRARH